MRVEILYFAAVRDLVGREAEWLVLPEAVATIRDLSAHLEMRHARLRGRLHHVRFAMNEHFVGDDDVLLGGATVALIPPVAGGAPAPHATISEAPLSVDRVLDIVRDRRAGALVVFVGAVRDHHDGQRVERLEYSAYVSMAEAEMGRIVTSLEAARPGVKLAVEHRVGALEIGDLAVVCAASAPHRQEAFEAARALIDAIKADVPIWKREHAEAGVSWVGWPE